MRTSDDLAGACNCDSLLNCRRACRHADTRLELGYMRRVAGEREGHRAKESERGELISEKLCV